MVCSLFHAIQYIEAGKPSSIPADLYTEPDIDDMKTELIRELHKFKSEYERASTMASGDHEAVSLESDPSSDAEGAAAHIQPVVVLNDIDFFAPSNRASMVEEDPEFKKTHAPKSDARHCACDCRLF
jgi:hypothetical protein